MDKEIKAVAYARVSSKEQAEKELSIPAQLEAIRNYCKQKGWKLVHEYIDAGKSAKTGERPEFQRMIAMAKRPNRGFDAIIVHKVDRFSRNRDDHVIYKSLLKKVGVTVYSVTEQADPETPHGFLLEGIMEVISEFYNMNLKTETMKGMKENAKRGYHNGGQAPFGYRTDAVKDSNGRTKSVWVLGPDNEVTTVRRIYDLYVRQNKGYKAITGILNEEGVPSPGGKLWSWSTIWHILHNPAYIGQKVWNKHDYSTGKKKKAPEDLIIRADAHPAIVDRDTFNAVTEKSLQRNYSEGAFKSTGPSIYLLRGLLKCPDCGTNMVTGSSSKSSRGTTRYYHCGTYHRKGSKSCKRNGVNKEKIDTAVINTLMREFSLLGYTGVLEDEINKYFDNQNREVLFQIARIDDEIKYLQKRLDIAQKEESVVSKSQIDGYIKEVKSDISSLQNEKAELVKQKSRSDLTRENIKYLLDKLRNFNSHIKTEPPDVQHELLKEFVSYVSANKISGGFKRIYCLKLPPEITEKAQTVLEKVLYFSLDLQ